MRLERVMHRIESMPRWQLIAYAVLAIALIGFIDHLTGPVTSLSIFYLVPVAAIAWFVGKGAANLMAVLAAISWAASDHIGALAEPKAPAEYFNDISLLAVFVFMNVVISALRAQLERERDLLLGVQKRLLPKSIPQISEYDIAWCWVPAWTVAGDYYDVIRGAGDRYAICLGDVAGKGMPAALIMANVQATVHALTAEGLDPQRLMTNLNHTLSERLHTSLFVTMFYGVLDTSTGRLTYANAGHNPPIMVGDRGQLVRLEPTGPVAGIFPNADYGVGDVRLAPGDDLVLFSDGVTEYENARGEQFGELRLQEILTEHAQDSAQEICDAITRRLASFAGGRAFDDDVTILVVRHRERVDSEGLSKASAPEGTAALVS